MRTPRLLKNSLVLVVAFAAAGLAWQSPYERRAVAADQILFTDEFSSGDLSAWSSNSRFTIDTNDGSPAAPSAAMETIDETAELVAEFSPAASDLCAVTSVRVIDSGGESLTLLRLRSSDGEAIASLKVSNNGKLVFRSDFAKIQTPTGSPLPSGWNRVEVCGIVGPSGHWDVALNDVEILSDWQIDTGNVGAGQLVLGDHTPKTVSARWDAVELSAAGSPPPPPPPGPSETTIAAAGNIACDPNHPKFNNTQGTSTTCRMRYVSDMLIDASGQPRYETVLALGDNQYVCGGPLAYQASYGATWGRVYDVTKPVVGDKDYRTTKNAPDATDCSDPPGRAEGFFDYFDGIADVVPGPTVGSGAYYSFEVPEGCDPSDDVCWHVIALNGNCRKAKGCEPGTAQYSWLEADLAAHPNSEYACTLAYWHWPRFSSGKHGSDPAYDSIWRLLYQHEVEVVLNAHEHLYERFAPQNPDGNVDTTRGIRQFTVGTGGISHAKFPSAQRLPTSQASNDNTFGILTLTLGSDAYEWAFLPEPGKTFTDASTIPTSCH